MTETDMRLHIQVVTGQGMDTSLKLPPKLVAQLLTRVHFDTAFIISADTSIRGMPWTHVTLVLNLILYVLRCALLWEIRFIQFRSRFRSQMSTLELEEDIFL